jgi:hypothetical protein
MFHNWAVASRTRNRVLWIAALAGVTAATVVVVMGSHAGNRVRVVPLREGKTSVKPGTGRHGDARQDNGSRVSSTSRSAGATGHGELVRGRRNDSARHELPRAVDPRRHEGIRPVQATNATALPTRTVTPAPIVIPAPVSAPSDDSPAPSNSSGGRPDVPQTASTPEPDKTSIEIRHGELRSGPDGHVQPHGPYVTVSVRSDEPTVVEIEGVESSLPVVPGREVLVTVDADVAAHLEAKLSRRFGVLVLHLGD